MSERIEFPELARLFHQYYASVTLYGVDSEEAKKSSQFIKAYLVGFDKENEQLRALLKKSLELADGLCNMVHYGGDAPLSYSDYDLKPLIQQAKELGVEVDV